MKNQNKKLFGIFTAASILLSGTAFAETHNFIALTHIRVIDGTGNLPVEDDTLLFDKDKIIAIGNNIDLPPHTKILDRSGDSVLPGLISDHSHIGLMKNIQTGPEYYTKDNIKAALSQYQRYGVTTVMALGLNKPAVFNPIRKEAHEGKLPADLFGVEQGIGVPDGAPPLKIGTQQIFRPATPEEAKEAVDKMAEEGTDLVKIWVDDFNGSVPQKMSPSVIEATIAEAHRHNIRVAAHIHDLADAKEVINDGADIIAHGVRDQLIPNDVIAKMKARHIWYIPTLQLDEATTAWAEEQTWTNQAFYKAGLSKEFLEQINDPAWRNAHKKGKEAAFARKSLYINLQNLKRLYEAHVNLGFGTDSGAQPLRIPGVAEHRELALYKEAGLPPLSIIHIATENAAALLDLKDRGVLAPGKRADLLVVSGDPSKNISDVNNIVEVWHSGHSVKGPTQ
ncbi:amidohydrolase family protein [Aristophania vespae]|uniref:Amidohydrolase family protein n=1 Tax=Aristophania vespae TaxID=2697033 RepID=A0A6P1N8Y7_9PROT|nr:amidohydrolase family protein [Aristophania vespae]QHI95005.1 amidohydrolase family protein [Aristophania vespae]